MNKRFIYGMLALLAVLGGVPVAHAENVSLKETLPHITTLGRASREVVPDETLIELGIRSKRPSAIAASSETAQAASRLVAELDAEGIDKKDIQTDSVALTAVYDQQHDAKGYEVGERTLRGYEAREDFTVRIRDIAKAGMLAQKLIETGANEFRGISFHNSRSVEIRRDLKAQASKDALAEAENYSQAVGARLGRVLQIGDDQSALPGDAADLPSRRMVPFAKTSVAIPIEPGVENLEEAVSITWELLPGR